jgi:hypothetical protein
MLIGTPAILLLLQSRYRVVGVSLMKLFCEADQVQDAGPITVAGKTARDLIASATSMHATNPMTDHSHREEWLRTWEQELKTREDRVWAKEDELRNREADLRSRERRGSGRVTRKRRGARDAVLVQVRRDNRSG